MKKILFVSFFSPPIGSGGGERVLKLLKYLKNFEKFLLTSDYPSYKYRDDTTRIPEDVKVIRVFYKDPRFFIPKFLLKLLKKRKERSSDIIEKYRELKSSLANRLKLIFFIPDDKITWVKDSIKIAKKLVLDNKIDVVYTSGPPHSVHLIGKYLKKFKNIKWVMELRDLWSENPFVEYPNFVRRKNRKIESTCLEMADLIVVVNRSFKDRLLKEHNFLNEDKIKVVYGGFDKKDFEIEKKDLKGFSIVYSGSFYSLQTPIFFLKAFKDLLEENEDFKNDAKFYILGPFEETIKKIIDDLSLNNFVSVSGFLPHKESISFILGAELLFLFLGRGGEETVPQKLFEYLGSKRRILATVPDGECKEILLNCKVDSITEPDDIEMIKRNLLKIYHDYKSKVKVVYDEAFIERFSMENIIKDFLNSLQTGGIL